MDCARNWLSIASLGGAAVVWLAAAPALAQRYAADPTAHAQSKRAVGATNGDPYAAAHDARGGREDLAPVGQMRRKLRPPELLAEALSTPQDAFREGVGWPLAKSLARASDRSQQVRIAQLYWKLAGAQAEYHFAREQSHLLWKATERHANAAAVQAARFNAEGAVNDCEVSVIDAQHELAEALRLGPNDALPLAIDRPHVGDYKTHFEAMFTGGRTPPARLRLTNRAIPIRRKAIDVHGEAILAAQDSVDATIEEFERGSIDLTTLLAGFSELERQRRAFVRSVRDYNQDIAEYALSVAPQGSREDALVAMLIRTPTPRTAVGGERRGEAPHRGESESVARGRTFGQYDEPGARAEPGVPRRAVGEEPRAAPRDEYGAPPRDDYRAASRDDYRSAPPREDYRAAQRNDDRAAPRNDDRFATPDYAAPPREAAAPRDDYRPAPPRDDYRSAPPRDDYRTVAPRDDYGAAPRDDSRVPAGRDDYRAPAAGSYDPSGQGQRMAPPPAARYAAPGDYRSSQNEPAYDPRYSPANNPRYARDPAVVPAAAEGSPARFGAVDDAGPMADPQPARDPFPPRQYESQKPILPAGPFDGSPVDTSPLNNSPFNSSGPLDEAAPDDDRAASGNPASNPANKVKKVTANYQGGESVPNGSPDQGEYSALQHLSPALRAQRLSGILHWWQRNLPPDSGHPTSLTVALERVPASQRKQVIGAYWRAREAAAHYQALVEADDHLTPLASWATRATESRHAPSAMLRLQAARLGLHAESLDAHVGLIVAEYNLAVATGTSLEAAWPLPTTIPQAGRYRVPESHLVHRAASYSADHLPPLQSSIQDMAAAVIFADAARAEAMHPTNASPQAIQGAISRIYAQLSETQSFLRNQTEYNMAIADYALRTLPAGASAEQVVSRLVIARNLRDGA